jgi:hypothetical protein
MGTRDFRSYVGMARPVLTERDYQTVKKLVMERARNFFFFIEAERLEAMIRELNDYEQRSADTGGDCTIGWAEWVFVPKADGDTQPRRRWSDLST